MHAADSADERLGAFLLGAAPVDGGFRDDAWWIWCGSPARGDDGRYHLFASRWSKRTAFNPNWVTNSRVVRAVSSTPMGPYAYADDVLPPRDAGHWDGRMTHNPTIHRHGNTWLLFYTGSTFAGDTPDAERLDCDDPRRVTARANQRVGLATAPSPAGPWTRRDAPILAPRAGHWDALMVTNPAPVVHADGSVLLLYKSTEDERGRLRYGVAFAEHWSGPYRRLCDTPLFDDGSAGSCYEDAFVWRERGRYQMIFKDMTGRFGGERDAGSHADSDDGVTWTFRGRAYPKQVRWSDGRTVQQACFERPQILCDAQGNAAWLFAATGDGPGGFVHAVNTWTMARPFRLA